VLASDSYSQHDTRIRTAGQQEGGRARRRMSRGKGETGVPKRRRHPYLVLDDWSGGYSIRKIDLLSDPTTCARS
jgi:hypothetical protein